MSVSVVELEFKLFDDKLTSAPTGAVDNVDSEDVDVDVDADTVTKLKA